jgi:hypothetical protein
MPSIDPAVLVSVISIAVAILTWATSANKSRVQNLCQIIDAQAKRITDLEQDLGDAKVRITDLEEENRWHRVIFSREGIDPDRYCETRTEGANGKD